jgi:hypothetical protein
MSWLSWLFRTEPKISIPRRLLLMLRELHRMGYERLRAVTGLHPSGCFYRIWITPATSTVPPGSDFMATQNRGVAVGDWVVYLSNMDIACYSTGEKADQCFGWTDIAEDSPWQLAKKFIKRFPKVVKEGKGIDPAYSCWYANMIKVTEPEGLVYMYADWELPSDHIPVLNREGVSIPPPPRVVNA